jgi:hypothetical protein
VVFLGAYNVPLVNEKNELYISVLKIGLSLPQLAGYIEDKRSREFVFDDVEQSYQLKKKII